MTRRLFLALLAAATLGALGVLTAGSSTSATQPFNPVLKITGISDHAPSANADITFQTTLQAGDHILGNWALMNTPNSWTIAADNHVADGDVTAVGTMTIDKDCNGTPDTFGPFPLTDQPSGGDVAHWFGNIASFWNMTLVINGDSTNGFTASAIMTNALNVTLCTPQTFTITFCGHANPVSTATVCGTANPVVMTNPSTAGTYTWSGTFIDESGAFFASSSDSVCIMTSCPTPTPTPVATPTPTPTPTPCPDSDGDGWTDCAETVIGTNPNLACGTNAWPPDFNSDTHVDITDMSTLLGSFGKAVPPGLARYDIAPDPPDRFIDVTDIARLSGLFGKSCTP